MNLGTWISVPKAARLMGLTRQGALKRLQILDREADGQLLRRISTTGQGGRFEVSMEMLQEIMVRKREKPDEEERLDREILQTSVKLRELETQVEALRKVYAKLKKQVASILVNDRQRSETPPA